MMALEEAGITAWLDQGTLLGLIREGRLLPWDHDVDLGAWDETITENGPQLAAALERRLSGKAKVAWGLRTIGINPMDEEAYLPVNIGLYSREAGQAVKWFGRPPEGMTVSRRIMKDLAAKFIKPLFTAPTNWLLHLAAKELAREKARLPPLLAKTMTNLLLDLKDRGRDTVAAPIKTSVDADYFDRLRPVQVADLRLAAPADTEQYLALKYGPSWRTPKKEWRYWEQDGAIVSK